jgi:hypothetical protein
MSPRRPQIWHTTQPSCGGRPEIGWKFGAGEARKAATTARSLRLAEATGGWEDLSVTRARRRWRYSHAGVAMIVPPFAGLLMAARRVDQALPGVMRPSGGQRGQSSPSPSLSCRSFSTTLRRGIERWKTFRINR